MIRKFVYIGLAILIILGSPLAHAALVTLSDANPHFAVSDGPTPPPLEDLFADLTFTVAGDVLTVTVHNRTDENVSGNTYSIAEIFFNAPPSLADVPSSGQGQEAGDGLVMIGGGVWKKDTEFGHDFHHINGFGYFDMYIRDGGQQVIGPGQTMTFDFTINPLGGGYTGEDFAWNYSSGADPATSLQMIAGAKFVQGPGDISGFGAVPEPATIVLLGLGSLALIRRRKA